MINKAIWKLSRVKIVANFAVFGLPVKFFPVNLLGVWLVLPV